MNRGKISNQFLLYFLMMMFLMVIVSCGSSSSSPPPPAGTTYTVTFDSQSASVAASPTSKTVVSPATTVVALPTEPTKAGYTFAGWWTGTNGTGTEFIASTPVTADITVYANWSTNPVNTVTYNSDGGTDVGIQHAMSSGGTVGTLPAAPTKAGYIFGGWYTAVGGGGSQFFASTPVTTNITVYAKWNSYSYTVTFDSQGATLAASPTSIIVASPATTVVTLPAQPTRTGYTFAGWWTATNGTGTTFTASTTVTASITVYANWSTNPVYTVTYSSEGGTAVGAQQVVSGGTVGTLPAPPTKTGYIFGGWYTDTSYVTAFTASTTVTANITVYAKWNSYSYTVTFDSQGATVAASPASIIVASPATTVGTLPTPPTKTGYTFAGWYPGTNGSGTQFTATTTVTGDITVYAYWSANPVYTVTYDSQGGTAVGAQHVTSPATTVGALPSPPTKTGYIFGGWYTDTSYVTAFTASTTVAANITVYAKWNSYSYTVTFDSQGATVAASPASIIVASPATTVGTLPTAPTKTGYTFAGWYPGTNGSGTQFTASTTVTGNITVYAYWSANAVYTVTYDSQGGTAVAAQQVVSGGTVGTLPAAPTKSGYTFGGWYTQPSGSGTQFTASATVNGNITVYAKWTVVTGTATASGTYTWSLGTGDLTFNWTSSTFPCNGPSLGTETTTGVTITATTMTWPNSNDGAGMIWTRSPAGTPGDPAGTWTTTDQETGIVFTVVATPTNSTSGTVYVSAPTTTCGSRDYNPGAESSYQPGNNGYKYQVWMWYDDHSHSASAVSATGSGIPGSEAFTYGTSSWSPTNGGVNFGNTAPPMPLTYTFSITDTSTWTKTVTVNCFLDQYVVTNLVPTGTINTATPTFTWTGISPSDATYEVELFDSNYAQLWKKKKYGGTSVLYDGPVLVSGNTYNYMVSAYSRSKCQDGDSEVWSSFTYQHP